METRRLVCRVLKCTTHVHRELRFHQGLAFKAHRLVHHSTPGWRVIKKEGKIEVIKKKEELALKKRSRRIRNKEEEEFAFQRLA